MRIHSFVGWLALSSSLCGAAALVALPARASPSGKDGPAHASAAETPPRLEILLVGLPVPASFSNRVASWFPGGKTVVRAHRVAALDPDAVLGTHTEAGVRVWIVLRAQATARVFFSVPLPEGQRSRYLVRDLELPGGLDELGTEQLAQVVALSAAAVWAGRLETERRDLESLLALERRAHADARPRAPETRSASPARATEGRAAEPPRPRAVERESSSAHREASTALSLGAGYAARFAGEEGLVQGPLAAVELAFPREIFAIGGRLEGQLLLPREPSKQGIRLGVRGYALAAGVTLTRKVSVESAWTGELGLGVDLIDYEPLSVTDPALTRAPGELEARPTTYARLGFRERVGPIQATLAASLAVHWFRTQYDIVIGGERSSWMVPWQVQPGLFAGATW